MTEYYYDYATPETMEKKEEDTELELQSAYYNNLNLDDRIVEDILKIFYKQIGLDVVPSEFHDAMKMYVVKQYKNIHCCNIRAKHVNDKSSKIGKILKQYDILIKPIDTFSIVGTYKNIKIATGSNLLKVVRSY